MPRRPVGRREIALVSLGALGVVYGDIGTSPLYAIKECLAWHPQGASIYASTWRHFAASKIEAEPARPRSLTTEAGVGYRLLDG